MTSKKPPMYTNGKWAIYDTSDHRGLYTWSLYYDGEWNASSGSFYELFKIARKG